MNIYTVERLEESESDVCGVFSTLDKAVQFCRANIEDIQEKRFDDQPRFYIERHIVDNTNFDVHCDNDRWWFDHLGNLTAPETNVEQYEQT